MTGQLVVQALLVCISLSSAAMPEPSNTLFSSSTIQNYTVSLPAKKEGTLPGGETAAATADAAAAGGTLDTCSGTEEFTVTGGVDPSFDGCYEVAEAYLSDYNTFSLGGVVADGPIFYVGDIDGDGSHWKLGYVEHGSTTSGGIIPGTATVFCLDQDLGSVAIVTHPSQVEAWRCAENQLSFTETTNFPLTITCGCTSSVSSAPSVTAGPTVTITAAALLLVAGANGLARLLFE